MEDKNNIDPGKIPNLPTELQWDSMESKIVDKMDELEKDDRRRRLFFWLFFFGVVTVASWMIWPEVNPSAVVSDAGEVTHPGTTDELSAQEGSFVPGYDAEEHTEPQSSSTAKGYDKETMATSDLNDNKIDLDGISDVQVAKAGPSVTTTKIRSNTDVLKSPATAARDGNSTPSTSSKSSKNVSPGTLVNSPEVNATLTDDDASIEAELATGSKASSTTDGRSTDIKEAISAESEMLNITALPALSAVLPLGQRSLRVPSLVQYENTIKDEEKTLATHQLSLLAGTTMWGAGYGAVVPERAAFENSIPSFATQANYTYTAPSRWTLTTGVQYQRLESEFNYTEQLEDVPVTLFDTIILIQQNAISGNQNFIRGDVNLLTDGQRRVQHFNRTELFQVPIAIGYAWETGPWTANVGGGTAFNLLTTHTGKTIINGSIAEYGNADNDILSTKLGVNGLLYGAVTYRIRQRWGITASTSFQKSISNWSTEPDISMKPTVLNFALGLSYKL